MSNDGLQLNERPMPPADLVAAFEKRFLPAPEVEQWFRSAFLDENSPLYNVEHDHLNSALIGVLWTNVENTRQMRKVVGMIELPKPHPALGKWAKARQLFQTEQWFGADVELDFLMTLDANYCAGIGDVEFCALVEHELYHCGHKYEDGMPAFDRMGRPKFAIRGHDVEEFVGIVRRYGPGAAAGETRALVAAARSQPEVAAAEVALLCGVCAR